MPSQCQVSGNLQSLSGGTVSQGTVIFTLSNIGIGNPLGIIGTSLFPNLKYVVQTAGDGSFTTKLWGNDNINPANTIYNVTYRDSYGNEVGPIQYSITGSSFNLNSGSPINSVVPPVLTATTPVFNLLNQQGPLAAITGTGADATLYTYTIPANTVRAGQGIRVTAYWSHSTGTANVIYKLKLGTASLTIATINDFASGSSVVAEIFNNAAVQNAQNWGASYILGGSPAVAAVQLNTSSENLANADTVSLTFSVANTDQVTPKSFLVELINGPASQVPSRLQVFGSPLVTGDFVLSGWGTGATITAIRGCDSANEFLITCGTGPSVGPTVQLTFHDGPYANQPITLAEIVGGTGQSSTNAVTGTVSSWTLTYQGFPVAGQTYLYKTISVGI